MREGEEVQGGRRLAGVVKSLEGKERRNRMGNAEGPTKRNEDGG